MLSSAPRPCLRSARKRPVFFTASLCLLGLVPAQRAWAAPDDESPAPPGTIELRDVPHPTTKNPRRMDLDVAFQDGRRLDEPTLYRLVGREDLARAWKTRGIVKSTLAISALASLVGGVGLGFLAPHTPGDCSRRPPRIGGSCPDEIQGGKAWGIPILTLLALAPAFLVSSAVVDEEPVTDRERQRLIDGYNQTLAPSPPRRPAEHDAGLTIAPALHGGSGEVMWRMTF